jgi:hypothetical protein
MRAGLAAALIVCLGVCAAITGLGGLGGCVIYLNPQCTDQIKNGEETGLDCGGTCGKCNVGEGCRVDADCDAATCTGGVCTPLPCDNGVKDGDETDVDCGGSCRRCAGGRTCANATDCFSGTCTAAQACSALTLSFAEESRYASGYKAYAMLPADLDGDGDVDVAVINEYGSSVSVFLNDYDHGGTFRHLMNPAGVPRDDTFPNFGPTGAYPTGGGIADFNHDGKLDVVTADYHGNSITVLLNDGTGALDLAPPASYPTVDGGETSNLAVGDLDKDGNADVVATNPQKASVSEFLGRADGTFAPAINLPVGVSGAAQPYSVAIGDFDRDGNNDLAIAEETSGAMVVRLGNGDATFRDEVSYPIDGVRDYIVIARDINLDNVLDLVCANRNGDTVSVLIGRGDGTFRKAVVTSVVPEGVTFTVGRPWYGPYSVTVGDVNADGVPDIVTANFAIDSVSIMLGRGDGRFDSAYDTKFKKPIGTQLPDTTPYGVMVQDFNGDGKPDIATANAGSYDLTVKLSTAQ